MKRQVLAVGIAGRQERAVAQRPSWLVEFCGYTVRIPPGVGREIPRPAFPQRPVPKLRARIMAVRVRVEQIGSRQAPDREREAGNVLVARQLISRAGTPFLRSAQANDLTQKVASDIRI